MRVWNRACFRSKAADEFVAQAPGWSSDVGLYFHAYGHASVDALHLHIVDLSTTGPSFGALSYKNLPRSTPGRR